MGGKKMLVLNAERKTGKFLSNAGQTIDYDNLYFTVDTLDNTNMIFGNKYSQIKVSVKDFNKFYPHPVETLKGKNVIFAFDQNKKLIGIYDVK